MDSENAIYTIGHSNHPLERFLELLAENWVEAVIDTRSAPVSGYSPHFNREGLEGVLRERGVEYQFQGGALGGKPNDRRLYDADGKVLYSEIARHPAFLEAVEWLERYARSAGGPVVRGGRPNRLPPEASSCEGACGSWTRSSPCPR